MSKFVSDLHLASWKGRNHDFGNMLAQQFVQPLTVDGFGIEIRFHVLIASVRPLMVLYHPTLFVKMVLQQDSSQLNSHEELVKI
jgi:hypothetical protein